MHVLYVAFHFGPSICLDNWTFFAKNVIIFLAISLNICFERSKEPSHWEDFHEYHNMFCLKN